jgi:hypothetical protein
MRRPRLTVRSLGFLALLAALTAGLWGARLAVIAEQERVVAAEERDRTREPIPSEAGPPPEAR